MLSWIAILCGITIIYFAGRDILLTVMTPTGRGAISRRFMALVWRSMRPVVRRWHGMREIAGPVTFLGVIGIWTAMIVVGWGLIYWSFLPDEFLVDFGLDLERNSPGNFLAAIYFSMVVLTTLGFGDIVPTGEWLRLLAPLEGLIGFGLLTAGISWFLSIFPALSRRRRLAHQIALVREAEEDAVERWDEATMTALLSSFSTQLIDIRSDQIQFPVMYYFRDADPDAELVPNLRFLLDLSSRAEEELGEVGSPMFLHQYILRRAVDDYVETVASQFLNSSGDDTQQLLDALARDRL